MPSTEIEPLFEQALLGNYDDEAAWDAVHELRALGTREVFDRAKVLCSSQRSLFRARGADILAQLGVTMETHANAFPEESFSIITTMLNEETDPVVLNAAIVALGHLHNDTAIPAILHFVGHRDSGVRFATAFALGSVFEHPASLDGLIPLSRDSDADVRNWATFGIARSEHDSPEVRVALAQRLDDPCEEARMESLIGLGKRKDPTIAAYLLPLLERREVAEGYIEAANLLLSIDEADNDQWKLPEFTQKLREIALSS